MFFRRLHLSQNLVLQERDHNIKWLRVHDPPIGLHMHYGHGEYKYYNRQ